MTSNTLAPCPQAEIDPDSLTALSDDEMLEGPPDWWAYSKKWRNELNRNRNEQRAFDWSLKNSARELIRFRIQNAKRDQGKIKTTSGFHATNSSKENRAMLAALGLEEDSDSAEEEAEEETEEEAEQQAEEEHSNAEQQAEEEPSNAEQAAEDAPDGETEEQGDGQSE
jgi:hypothetical protein